MKEGDYVRTKYGKIGKIINISKNRVGTTTYLVEWGSCKAYYVSQVKDYKSSPDIIDLIELGDLVKIEFEKDDTNVFEVVAIDKNNNEIGIFNNNFEFDWVGIEQLKSIVTREQMESMEYRL